MRSSITQGDICLTNDAGITYVLGTMTYRLGEDESFLYVFEPKWSVIDLLEPPLFQGIPGFDLSLRLPEYRRENMVPTFISERAPAPNREHLWELLEAVGMDHLNQLEWLIRTDTRYIGDGLFVRRHDEKGHARNAADPLEIESAVKHAKSGELAAREVLRALGEGADVALHGRPLQGESRKALHDAFMLLYAKSRNAREEKRLAGVERGVERGAYKGRRRKPVDELELREAIELHGHREITAAEAARRIGVSVPTFYRRMKELS